MSRSEWLAERRTGIGSSDIAVLMGIDAFGKTPIDVYLSKVDPNWKTQQSPILRQGLALEPVIAREYTEQTGRRLTYRKYQIFRHAEYPELMATPDRLVKNEKRFVELKCEFFGHNKFGQSGSDQVPDNYLAQVAHQYLVLDYDAADIARMRPGRATEIYPVSRDMQLEEMIIERAREFWHNYVLARREPPIDYGATWGKYLAQKFPKDNAELLTVDEETNPEALALIRSLAQIKSEAAEAEKRQSEIEHKLKALIAENGGLIGPWGRLTWKLSKDQKKDVVDWEAALGSISEQYRIQREYLDLIVKDCTEPDVVVKKGSRRFVLDAKE